MILVDTSVWIDLLLAKGKHTIRETDLLRFATCGPIVQEVVQGLRPGLGTGVFLSAFLALPVLSDPIPITLFMAAADIYSTGRRRGMTIRSSVDCLIAAIAIENKVPVWHNDRDFDAIARYANLAVVRSPA